MARRVFLLIVTVLLLQACATARGGHVVNYTGDEIYDNELGILVLADDQKRVVIVSSDIYHYSIILPYSTEWEFTSDESSHLKGNSGLVNLTLAIYESDKGVKEYLKLIKDDLTGPMRTPGLEKADIIMHKGEPVLRTQIDAYAFSKEEAFRDVKHINFFVAKRRDNLLYFLHLSRIVSPDEDMKQLDEAFRTLVTAGFSANFMAEEEAK